MNKLTLKGFFKGLYMLPRRMLAFPIKLYRKYLSPLKASPCCRFTPTCSEYALEAIDEWGFFAGGALALWRILRCNPFGKAGYDPVPKRRRNTKTNDPSKDA